MTHENFPKALIIIAICIYMTYGAVTPTQNLTLDLPSLRKAELAKHNYDRSLHKCSSIKLNDTLNRAAQKYAEYLASIQKCEHSPAAKNGNYGENIYFQWRYPTITYQNAAATDNWYSENKFYNYQTGVSFQKNQKIGHFTAMIWKSVTDVGFGYAITAKNNGYAIYVVANYWPVPNMVGEFTKNVPPPISK